MNKTKQIAKIRFLLFIKTIKPYWAEWPDLHREEHIMLISKQIRAQMESSLEIYINIL